MPYATTKTIHRRDLTTKEAADALGCSERTIRNMIEAGTLPAYRLTPAAQSSYRVSPLAVETILAARKQARRYRGK
jgi:excisionase family DNA binding protein